MVNSPDKNYNIFIAQSLGLNEELDFLNDIQALHEAEREIHQRSLDKEYLQALNEIDSTQPAKGSLDDFKTEKTDFRAFAIIKLLKKMSNL